MILWSVKRRLSYLALVAGCLALVVAAVWYGTRPGPTCFDNKRNQDELDIDCGGSCARVCPFEVKPLREVWSRVFQFDADRYDVATLLKNPNRYHAARQLKYRLRLFDRNGVLVTTREAEAFVNPGESVFLYNARFEAGNREPERVVFDIVDGPIWQRVDREPPNLQISYKPFVNEPSPLLLATVENSSPTDLADIQVIALLSDEAQNALAISSTLIEELKKGERREIAFTWPKSFPIPPTFVEFYPHFDLAGLP